jgi:alcohol dehydrogenase (cytochrome c)
MVGTSGGEFGIRGYVAALDAETGKEVWRSYTIPAPGEPAVETWKRTTTGKPGGGSVWITGHYDPKLNLVYWGTGNPGTVGERHAPRRQPVHGVGHRARRRYRQAARLSPVRRPTSRGIGTRSRPRSSSTTGARAATSRVSSIPARNGYLWLLERQQDAIKFIDAKPFVKQEVFTRSTR